MSQLIASVVEMPVLKISRTESSQNVQRLFWDSDVEQLKVLSTWKVRNVFVRSTTSAQQSSYNTQSKQMTLL